MKSVKIFLIVFILHQIIQGYFWSVHPGNTPPGKSVEFAKYGWNIFSFPIEFLPGSLADILGMWLLFINSLLWAGIITFITRKVSSAKKQIR